MNSATDGATRSDDEGRLATQLDALLHGRGFRWLRFPPQIEREFHADCESYRRRLTLVLGALAYIINIAFLLSDRQMVPDIFGLAVLLRLGVVTPLGVVGQLLIYRGAPWYIREAFVGTVAILIAATLLVFMSQSHSPQAQHYYVGLPLIVVFINTAHRIRFWFGVATSLVILPMAAFGLVYSHTISADVAHTVILVQLCTTIFTLISLYFLEHEERRAFVLQLRDRLQHRRELRLLSELSDANRRLNLMSRADALTGIANRRYLEEYLDEAWLQACQRQTPLSALMLDIDFFKAYNDRYGHVAGDECLRRIAAALHRALRQTGDFVARYGGEEFVAVLPGAGEPAALAAAERVRLAVEHLHVPHDSSRIADHVTVSVGAATLYPQPGQDEDLLVGAADRALYAAKAAGRNRVHAAA